MEQRKAKPFGYEMIYESKHEVENQTKFSPDRVFTQALFLVTLFM